jgi:PilX N-terminal
MPPSASHSADRLTPASGHALRRRVAAAQPQRGVAALVVTMTLFFAMLLVAVFANRNLVFEQRASANQYRATQAFEAAEAGLEWAQAQLNNVARLDESCKASSEPGAAAFRERYLTLSAAGTGFSPVQWAQAGVPTALQPACVRGDAGWQCSCPASGHPRIAAAGQGTAFSVELQAGAKAGTVRLISRGCSGLGPACVPGSTGTSDAVARVEVSLALLPGLASAPAAALTLRGGVDAGGAALGVHNTDIASGSVALHSGGSVAAPLLRIGVAPGAAAGLGVVSQDARLAAFSAAQLFASYFGLDRVGWTQQPVVSQVSCDGNCATALEQAVSAAGSNALIRVAGNADIEGPLTLGTRQQPVIVVVEGTAQLRGAVQLNGLLYAGAVRWDAAAAGAGATLRGALVSETSYAGGAAPDLVYDPSVLALLRGRTGMFARVSGSWRDF